MRNVKKVLLMINLLNTRQSVSLKTFMEVCRISRRSVFRYLGYISEACIPVYYDRESMEYRLSATNTNSNTGLSVENYIFLLAGLMTLSSKVDSAYKDEIEMLVNKIISKQNLPIEDIVESARENFDGVAASEDITDLLSWTLISAAITCRKKIRIQWKKPQSKKTSLEIVSPSLCFKKNWHIVDSGSAEPKWEPLSEVTKVSVL